MTKYAFLMTQATVTLDDVLGFEVSVVAAAGGRHREAETLNLQPDERELQPLYPILPALCSLHSFAAYFVAQFA